MDSIECVVVGAGVVGLAIARALALAGREVLVIEAETSIGSQTSARNSEVIHAGIYYPKGSLKARLCVEGREQLYAYCQSRHVHHRRCGKLIVATKGDQLAALDALLHSAAANGVQEMRRLSAAQAQALEPAVRCVGALLSETTGIIDSHGFMLSLQGEAEEHGAVIAFATRVSAITPRADGLAVSLDGEAAPQLLAQVVVNSAGLYAPALADCVEGLAPAFRPSASFAKGSYFVLSGRAPFDRLIYPMPETGGLGVHLTLDLAGQARFGPDVEWVQTLDYTVDASHAARFEAAVRTYWPDMPQDCLAPGYAGIRPKLGAPGDPASDFRIDGPREHGIGGLINLFGIESPGLTASLALADVVAGLASIEP